MARTSNSWNGSYDEGTLARTFREEFKFGRETEEECEWNFGLMPDPEKGCDDVNLVFHDNLYRFSNKFNKKRLTTAIMGVHTIGSAKVENSGYKGSWSKSDGTFNNDYYLQMLTRGWGPDRSVEGNDEINQWKIVDSGVKGLMMLNSDICLAFNYNP